MDLSPEEEGDISKSLSRILEYVGQLNEVETKGIPPCTHILQELLKNPMRADEPRDLLPRDSFLANAPEQIGGMVRVPPVLK